MRLPRFGFNALRLVAASAWLVSQAAATCTPTNFSRDSINLAAALISPKGTVKGDIDATGCNIGIYYAPGSKGQVNGANIHGANYFGVVNDGANVDVVDSTIYDIGESPLNGDQHGVAIYFAFDSHAQGDIHDNTTWNYQKGGIVVNGPFAESNVHDNTVIGQGPVSYIAQNGIQLGYGAQGAILKNIVIGNSYTGANLAASGGIILVGGACYGGGITAGVEVQQNIAVGNDIGVWFSNLDVTCNPVATPTLDGAEKNTVRNNAVNNTTGNGPTAGYQAGIADQGDGDVIQGNSICGIGYTPVTPPPFLYVIDVTVTNNVTLKNNTTCDATGPVTNSPINTAQTVPAIHGTILVQGVQ